MTTPTFFRFYGDGSSSFLCRSVLRKIFGFGRAGAGPDDVGGNLRGVAILNKATGGRDRERAVIGNGPTDVTRTFTVAELAGYRSIRYLSHTWIEVSKVPSDEA